MGLTTQSKLKMVLKLSFSKPEQPPFSPKQKIDEALLAMEKQGKIEKKLSAEWASHKSSDQKAERNHLHLWRL